MEIVKPSEEETKRRSELISQSKTRNLSSNEVEELEAILTREARYSYASGKIGFIAFVCIQQIIRSLPLLSGVSN